ncbi:MAG: acyltransferase domain-containing protein [Bacteroidales bacterium]
MLIKDYELLRKSGGFIHKKAYDKNTIGKEPLISDYVFVYSGMGANWSGMGQMLYHNNTIFKEAIDRCDSLLKNIAPWSLVDELLRAKEYSKVCQVKYAQVFLFVIQYALSCIWKNIGITPSIVVGHSYGETYAFYEAGILSLEDALLIAYAHGITQESLEGVGKMLAIECSLDSISQILNKTASNISIAAINSSSSIIVSGSNCAIKALEARLDILKINYKYVWVDIPYHSSFMTKTLSDFFSLIKDIRFFKPCTKLVSTVTGTSVTMEDLTCDYFLCNIQKTVLFKCAINFILKNGYRNFIEIGPHPILLNSINDNSLDMNIDSNIFYSMRRNKDEISVLAKNIDEVNCSRINIQ